VGNKKDELALYLEKRISPARVEHKGINPILNASPDNIHFGFGGKHRSGNLVIDGNLMADKHLEPRAMLNATYDLNPNVRLEGSVNQNLARNDGNIDGNIMIHDDDNKFSFRAGRTKTNNENKYMSGTRKYASVNVNPTDDLSFNFGGSQTENSRMANAGINYHPSRNLNVNLSGSRNIDHGDKSLHASFEYLF